MSVKLFRWISVICLGFVMVLASGNVAASAHPNGAGMDCEVFDDPMTCYTGGDGYQGGGAPPTTTAIGRSFLTDSDVGAINAVSVSAHYVAAEWDRWRDFVDALSTYWNLNAPIDRSCTITPDTGTGGGSGCLATSFSSMPAADGGLVITMTPIPQDD